VKAGSATTPDGESIFALALAYVALDVTSAEVECVATCYWPHQTAVILPVPQISGSRHPRT